MDLHGPSLTPLKTDLCFRISCREQGHPLTAHPCFDVAGVSENQSALWRDKESWELEGTLSRLFYALTHRSFALHETLEGTGLASPGQQTDCRAEVPATAGMPPGL